MDSETRIDPRATYARMETERLVSLLKELYDLALRAKRAGHHRALASIEQEEVADLLLLLADPEADAATLRSTYDSLGDPGMLAAVVETYEQVCDELARHDEDKPIYRSSLHRLLGIAGRAPTILPPLAEEIVQVENDTDRVSMRASVAIDVDPSSCEAINAPLFDLDLDHSPAHAVWDISTEPDREALSTNTVTAHAETVVSPMLPGQLRLV